MADAILAQSGIYQIINLVTMVRYIGQAANIAKRRQQHFKALEIGKHHCNYLQRAFDKHGADCFEFAIIELCSSKIATDREQFWMDHFSENTGIYNSAKAAGSPLGIKRSAETIAKLRSAKLGRIMSEETKLRMRNTHAKLKEQHKKRAKAQWANPEAIAKASERAKGRKFSHETRAKLRDGLLIRWSDPEYKIRVSKAQKSAQIKMSEKSSERMLNKWADPEYRRAMLLARHEARQKRVAKQ